MDQPTNSNLATDKQPGGLISDATMELHTRNAYALVEGRQQSEGKHDITGLRQCGKALRMILAGCREDDPYADWFLLQIHRYFETQSAYLKTLNGAADRKLTDQHGITLTSSSSSTPTVITLNFSSPYGYRAAFLLRDLDDFIRKVRTLTHVGLLTRPETAKQIKQATTVVRSAFHKTLGYRFTGITAADYQQRTVKAKEAIERWGEIPADVLDGSNVAPYAPPRLPVFNRGIGIGSAEAEVNTPDIDFTVTAAEASSDPKTP